MFLVLQLVHLLSTLHGFIHRNPTKLGLSKVCLGARAAVEAKRGHDGQEPGSTVLGRFHQLQCAAGKLPDDTDVPSAGWRVFLDMECT